MMSIVLVCFVFVFFFCFLIFVNFFLISYINNAFTWGIIKRPYLRQYWRGSILVREKFERKTSYTELFYDLVFVAAVRQLGQHLSEDLYSLSLSPSPSPSSPLPLLHSACNTTRATPHAILPAQRYGTTLPLSHNTSCEKGSNVTTSLYSFCHHSSGETIGMFVIMYAAIWKVWMDTTTYINQFSTDDLLHKVFFCLSTNKQKKKKNASYLSLALFLINDDGCIGDNNQ
jgi:hypothetical protein